MKKLIFLFLVVLVVGCSSKPTLDEMSVQLKKHMVKPIGQDVLTIENFQELNGSEKDSKTYVADVRYDIVFTQGMKELSEQIADQAVNSPFQALESGAGAVALGVKYGNFKTGQRVTEEQKITYIKTESGWRIDQDY